MYVMPFYFWIQQIYLALWIKLNKWATHYTMVLQTLLWNMTPPAEVMLYVLIIRRLKAYPWGVIPSEEVVAQAGTPCTRTMSNNPVSMCVMHQITSVSIISAVENTRKPRKVHHCLIWVSSFLNNHESWKPCRALWGHWSSSCSSGLWDAWSLWGAAWEQGRSSLWVGCHSITGHIQSCTMGNWKTPISLCGYKTETSRRIFLIQWFHISSIKGRFTIINTGVPFQSFYSKSFLRPLDYLIVVFHTVAQAEIPSYLVTSVSELPPY